MKFALGFAAALVASLMACAAPAEPVSCQGKFHFAPSFPQQYRGAVRTAMARWSDETGLSASVDAQDSDDGFCQLRAVEDGPEYQGKAARLGNFMAAYQGADGSILFAPFQWQPLEMCEDEASCVVWATMHEVGHSFGLQHTHGQSVMSAEGLGVQDHVTSVDLQECHRVGEPCR